MKYKNNRNANCVHYQQFYLSLRNINDKKNLCYFA